MPTAVVSGRVDETVRQRADVALRKAGLKPSDVIQAIWASMAQTGEVPEIAMPASAATKQPGALEALARFSSSLPPANPKYAGWSDKDLIALKAHDHA